MHPVWSAYCFQTSRTSFDFSVALLGQRSKTDSECSPMQRSPAVSSRYYSQKHLSMMPLRWPRERCQPIMFQLLKDHRQRCESILHFKVKPQDPRVEYVQFRYGFPFNLVSSFRNSCFIWSEITRSGAELSSGSRMRHGFKDLVPKQQL